MGQQVKTGDVDVAFRLHTAANAVARRAHNNSKAPPSVLQTRKKPSSPRDTLLSFTHFLGVRAPRT